MLAGLCVMHDRVDDSEEMASSSGSEDDEENDPCIMADKNLWSTQLPVAVTWIFDNRGWNKRILCIDYSAYCTVMLSIHDFVGGHAHHRLEEGQGVAGKALQSNIHFQRVWRNKDLHACFAIRLTSTHSCKDDYILEFYLPEGMEETSERELLVSEVLRTLQENCLESWKVWVGELNEASGFRAGLDDERMSNIPHEAVSSILQLPSSDGVLGGNEFMTFNTTSNQAGETHEPLEQDNSLESWKVWLAQLNEVCDFRAGLDDERMSNIPHEAVSSILQLPSSNGVLGGNEFMTVNTTSNQAGETHEPLEQSWKVWLAQLNEVCDFRAGLDDERMSNIPHEAVSSSLQLPSSDGYLKSADHHVGASNGNFDIQEQSAIAAPSLNFENASLIVDGGLQVTNKRRNTSSVWDKFDRNLGENGEDEAEQQPLIFETSALFDSWYNNNAIGGGVGGSRAGADGNGDGDGGGVGGGGSRAGADGDGGVGTRDGGGGTRGGELSVETMIWMKVPLVTGSLLGLY
uniref:NLP1-9 GAF domain-containing protein n=1 Tax=Salix viminalis TaxID=40686 RepID=A0A6N2LEU1_SALVM